MRQIVIVLVRVGELLPNVDGFIDLIGGIPPKTDAGDVLNDVNISEQGTFACRSDITANLPSSANGAYILINFQGGSKTKVYFVQFLFGLNSSKRYTRLKIDNSWYNWNEF